MAHYGLALVQFTNPDIPLELKIVLIRGVLFELLSEKHRLEREPVSIVSTINRGWNSLYFQLFHNEYRLATIMVRGPEGWWCDCPLCTEVWTNVFPHPPQNEPGPSPIGAEPGTEGEVISVVVSPASPAAPASPTAPASPAAPTSPQLWFEEPLQPGPGQPMAMADRVPTPPPSTSARNPDSDSDTSARTPEILSFSARGPGPRYQVRPVPGHPINLRITVIPSDEE